MPSDLPVPGWSAQHAVCGSCCTGSHYCGSLASDLTLHKAAGGLKKGHVLPAHTPMTCYQEDRTAPGAVGAPQAPHGRLQACSLHAGQLWLDWKPALKLWC